MLVLVVTMVPLEVAGGSCFTLGDMAALESQEGAFGVQPKAINVSS